MGVVKQCFEQLQPTYIASSVEMITSADFGEGQILGDFDTVLFDSRVALISDCETVDQVKVRENMRKMSQIGLDLYMLNEEGERRQDELESEVGRRALDIDIVCPEILRVEVDPSPVIRARHTLLAMIDYVVRKKRLPKERILMVGDSILTDVVAAHRAGVYSLLVPPQEQHNGQLSDGLRRIAENMIRKYLLNADVPAKTNDFPDEVRAANPLHEGVRVLRKNSMQRYLKKHYREVGED